MATTQRNNVHALECDINRKATAHQTYTTRVQNVSDDDYTGTTLQTTKIGYAELSGFSASEHTLCGCITLGAEVDNSNNTALYRVENVGGSFVVNEPFFKVLTERGYEDPDKCFCVNNDPDCNKCASAMLLLQTSHTYRLRHHPHICDRQCPEDFPSDLFNIKCFEVDSEDEDEEDCVIFCVEYVGPMKHRRFWHIVMPYGGCMICDHHVYAGILVPDVPHCRWSRTTQSLPWVDGRMIDTRRTFDVTSLRMLAFQSLEDASKVPRFLTTNLLADFLIAKGGIALPRPSANYYLAPPNIFKARRCVEAEPRGDESKAPSSTGVETDKETPELKRDMTQDKAANVELAETTEPSKSVVAQKPVKVERFIQDLQPTVDTLGDRWCRFDRRSWTTGNAQGTILARLDMPLVLLRSANCAPNTLLFNQYAYFKTDMEIEYQLNAAPGQSGLLIVGIMYNATQETDASLRIEHAAQLVQMPHMRLNAAGSNSGKMEVPWVYHLPVAPTRDMAYAPGLYYFTLFIGVLAPLRTGTGGSSTANLAGFARFKNLQFFGQRTFLDAVPRGLVGDVGALVGHPEIAKLEKLVTAVVGKHDCDRPNDPREPENLYAQQNTSLSLATGSNKVKLLQLLHDNTTPHPTDIVPSGNQFSSDFLKSTFGLSGGFQWSTANVTGANLLSMPVSPMASWVSGNTTYPTPLAGLSYYYGGYHGDMLVRFTFCISKFHSGRVIITYMPDASPANLNTTCYYSSVIDVQDQAVYTFRIPYQVPTLYAPLHTYYREWGLARDSIIPAATSTVYPSYGVVQVHVITPLVANQTASPAIDVLYEMCGASNFNFVYPTATQMPVFKTTEPTRVTVDKVDGWVRDVVEEGVEPNPGPVVAWPRGDDERHKTVTEKGPLIDIVPEWFNSLNERFEVRDVAKRYVTVFRQQSLNSGSGITRFEHVTMAHVSVYHMPVVPPTSTVGPIVSPTWQALGGNPIFARTYQIAHERINLRTNNTISFRVPWTSPMYFLANGYNPTLPNNAMQAYANGRVHIEIQFNVQDPRETYAKPESSVFSFDVTPSTLSARYGIEETDYNLLDFTSWMHDGFRFFRGDLNYQIDFLPYDRSAQSGLGWDMSMVISRALGDNASFYVFQGFPPVTRRLGNPINMLASQMVNRTGVNTTELQLRDTIAASEYVKDLTEEGIEPNPGPIISRMRNGYEQAMDMLEKLGFSKDFLARQVPRVLRFVTVTAAAHLSQNLAFALILEYLHNDFYSKFKNATENINGAAVKVKNLLEPDQETQFSNVMALVEVSAAVMNVWNSTGMCQTLINMAVLLNKFKLAKIVISKITETFDGLTPRGTDSGMAGSWVSIVISGIMAALGLKGSYKGDVSSYVRSVRDFFKDGVSVKRFVDAHFDFLTSVVEYFKKLVGRGEEKVPRDVPAEVVAWMESVNFYCEHYNADEMIESSEVAKMVFELRSKSIEFDTLFVSTGVNPPAGYFSYKNRLQNFINMLGKGGVAEKVRPTPFCMWMYGLPGIGKSRISDELLVSIGQEYGIVSEAPIYARTSETQYWNAYRQQPLIVFPDFAKNQTSETFSTEINEFMSLVDVWPFNPPFAELEDKRRVVQAQVVMVCSNFAFPNVTNVGHVETAAFDRRRHLLFKAYIPDSIVELVKNEFAIDINEDVGSGLKNPMASKIPSAFFEKYGTYGHLRFRRHTSGVSLTAIREELKFEEFIQIAKEQAKNHREKELAFCSRTRGLYNRLAPESWEERVNKMPKDLGVSVNFPKNTASEPQPSTSADPRGEEIESLSHSLAHVIEDIAGFSSSNYEEIVYRSCDSENRKALECGCVYATSETTLIVERSCLHNPKQAPRVSDATDDSDKTIYLTKDSNGIPTNPAVTWQGKIPTFEELNLRAYHGVMGFFVRKPYYKWEEVCKHCCHSRSILSRAYFDVVSGRVELCVDAEDGTKYILPPYCPQSRYESIFSINDVRFAPWGQVCTFDKESVFRSLTCQVTKRVPTFHMEGDVIKIVVDGKSMSVSDPTSAAIKLNQLMTGVFYEDLPRPADSYNVAMTFCHFRAQDRPKKWDGFKLFALEILEVIATLLVVAYAIIGIVMLYKMWRSGSMTSVPQAVYGGPNVPHAKNTAQIPVSSVVGAVPRGQEDVVIRMLNDNTCTIQKGTCTTEAVRLCSTFFLAPLHCLATPGNLSIYWKGSTINVDDDAIEMVPYANVRTGLRMDLCIFKVPSMPASKNIVGHFITEKESNVLKSKSEVIHITPEGPMVHHVNIRNKSEVMSYVSGSSIGKETFFNGYAWEGDTTTLRCGAMVMSNSRLVGMYIADDRSIGTGYAVAVTRELLNQGLEQLGATRYDMRIHRQIKETGGSSKLPIANNMIPLAEIDKPITYSGKTAIEPSQHSSKLPGPFLFPAEQRGSWELPGDEVVHKKVLVQSKPKEIPVKTHDAVSTFFLAFFLNIFPKLSTKKPLSVEQAVCGLDGLIEFPSMNLNTSLGWPLKDEYPRGYKKKNIISIDPPAMDSKAAEFYRDRNRMRSELIIPDGAFMDFPKDETLKPGKQTRLINGSCLDHFLDMRRYAWNFFVSMRSNPSICVGMDVHSASWGERMGRVSNAIDEDYSDYGPRLHSQVVAAIRDLAVKWHEKHMEYTTEDLNVVYSVFEEVRSCVHVASNLKYQVLCGSPSGSFGTDVINSLANMYYNMYSHYKKFGNFSRWDEEEILVYGDDIRRNQLRTHDEFKHHLTEIGLTISKDKNSKGAFLKRYVNLCKIPDGPKAGEQVALAPLPPHVLVDMLHWLRKPYFSEKEAFEQRLESFLSELFHYGKPTYEETVRKLSTMIDLKSVVIPDFTTKINEYIPLDFSDVKLIKNLKAIDIDLSTTDVSEKLLKGAASDKDTFDTLVIFNN